MKVTIHEEKWFPIYQMSDPKALELCVPDDLVLFGSKCSHEVEMDEHAFQELKSIQLQANQLLDKLQRKLSDLLHGDT